MRAVGKEEHEQEGRKRQTNLLIQVKTLSAAFDKFALRLGISDVLALDVKRGERKRDQWCNCLACAESNPHGVPHAWDRGLGLGRQKDHQDGKEGRYLRMKKNDLRG